MGYESTGGGLGEDNKVVSELVNCEEKNHEDRAIQQMLYTPNRHIRTEAAKRRAIGISDALKNGEALDSSLDETTLFAALHTCAFRANRVRAQHEPGKIERRRWVCRWKRIREHLVKSNFGLVYSMMARLRLDLSNPDDIHSDGLLALSRAVERFDPWRGIRFSTYACNLIVRDLINASRRATRYRRTFPYQYDSTFDLPIPMIDAGTDLYIERLHRALDLNLAGLTDLETSIISQRFPMDGPKRLTLQEIGDSIGVSKERIRQIQVKALDKLREVLDEDSALHD